MTLSLLMLVLTAPIWVLIAAAIKIEDGGSVFYRQERYGRGAERFHVRKFRSMIPDADDRFGILQAKPGDDRVTRVGRLLRATGLDELPQILSILVGDMSFVGPRPLAIGEIVENDNGQPVEWEAVEGFASRLSVRPGLTSLATVYLPKDVHPKRKFRYDLLYVRRQSFALDLKLIAISYWISVTGRWERRRAKV